MSARHIALHALTVPLLHCQAQSLSAKADLALPADMAACAAESGLRLSALQSYLGYAKAR